MATVTFTNPEYRDKSVYAIAGSHTQTVLKLALENKIPINFSCEDGECGTCVVKVSSRAFRTISALLSLPRDFTSLPNLSFEL